MHCYIVSLNILILIYPKAYANGEALGQSRSTGGTWVYPNPGQIAFGRKYPDAIDPDGDVYTTYIMNDLLIWNNTYFHPEQAKKFYQDLY